MSLLNSVCARSSNACLKLCQNAVWSSKRGGPSHGGDTPHLMSHRQLKIYTKTGDKGSSATLTGKRMPKSHPIFEALGNIDELSSHIGHAKELAAAAGHGYCAALELIQCVLQDSATAIARAPVIDSDGPNNVRGGKIVHMRGLPFRATEDDVIEFFQPLKAVNIEMGVGEDGRPSGKADVEFRNPADTADAMTRNKNNMQHRYIELFIDPAEGTCPAEEKVTVDGIDDKHIKELELSIDEMTAKLPPLKNFILPGGGQISSSLHVCRSVCRRAERSVSLVSQGNQVHPSVVAYINRLSDFLFMTSRLASQNEGHEDTIYRTPKQSLQFRP